MAHVVFIHGLANKPPREALLKQWLSALVGAAGGGLDLGAASVTSEMVYWADVLYPAPEPVASEGEDVRETGRGEDRDPGPSREWEAALPPDEQAFAEKLRLELEAGAMKARARMVAESSATTDRVFPLPKPLERLLMERLVRDAHHYLYGSTFEPRPGERFDVQLELRTRFVDALTRGAARPGPLVVVSHSMGTMIAYDCLRRVDGTPKVDGLITLGSPLGLSEVQDGWGKEWSARQGFPRDRVARTAWFNFYDRLDVVCAADPELANDYQWDGNHAVNDVRVRNSGSWRHYIREYLARDQVRDTLRRMLGI
jgi:pimeloyl-ACP methyl ester carboxylesterase